MSYVSDLWRSATPPTRSFYRNFWQRYTAQRFPDFDLGPYWIPRSTPAQLLRWNVLFQDWEWGQSSTEWVFWLEPWLPEYSPNPSLPLSYYYDNVVDDRLYIPAFADDYPRTALKVRRSYWTGAPAPRRNLPS